MMSVVDDVLLIDSIYNCSECSVSYRSHREIQAHLFKSHPQLEKRYICEPCGRLFERYEDLQEHSRAWHGLSSQHPDADAEPNSLYHKRSECNECGKRFALPSSLKRHVLTLHSATGEQSHKSKKSKKRKRKDEEDSDSEQQEEEEEETDANGKRLHRALVHRANSPGDESGIFTDESLRDLSSSVSASLDSSRPDGTPIDGSANESQFERTDSAQPPREYRFAKRLRCNSCQSSFGRINSLQRHLLAKHVARREFESSFYDKKYSSQRVLDVHMKLAKRARHPFEFETCGRKFYRLCRNAFQILEFEPCECGCCVYFDQVVDDLVCDERDPSIDESSTEIGNDELASIIDYSDVSRDQCVLEPDAEIFPASWHFEPYANLENEAETIEDGNNNDENFDNHVAVEMPKSPSPEPALTRSRATERFSKRIKARHDNSESAEAKKTRDFECPECPDAKKFSDREELEARVSREHDKTTSERSSRSKLSTGNKNGKDVAKVEPSGSTDSPRRTSSRILSRSDNLSAHVDSTTTYKCTSCPNRYAYLKHLISHINDVHEKQES